MGFFFLEKWKLDFKGVEYEFCFNFVEIMKNINLIDTKSTKIWTKLTLYLCDLNLSLPFKSVKVNTIQKSEVLFQIILYNYSWMYYYCIVHVYILL